MTDAVAFIEKHTRTLTGKIVFHLVFLFPILGAMISKLSRHRHLLNDYDALACGSWLLNHGLSPYVRHPVCPGLDPAPFVYAPQIARAFTPFIDLFGLAGSRMAWLPIVVPMMIVLAWYALFRPMVRAPYALRLMTLAAIAGSAVTCGNIGFVLNACVVLAALYLHRSRLPFILAVVVCALIKPVMLTYLFVLLVDSRPLWSRLTTGMAAAAAGLVGVVAILLTAGPLSKGWHDLLAFILGQQPGVGFFSYTSLIGLSGTSPVTFILLALFMVVIAASGWIVAEWGGLTPDERIVWGIGVAQLLNPRLMDYDMLALAPFVALLVMLARPLSQRIFTWVSWTIAGTLIGCVVTNIFEVPVLHRAPVTVFVYCCVTVAIAALTALRQRQAIIDVFNKAACAVPNSTSAS